MADPNESKRATIGSPTKVKNVFFEKEWIEIRITGSSSTNRLDVKFGLFRESPSEAKFIGVALIFFNVLPNNHPDINMAGIDITIPKPNVIPISAPGRCVTK